VQWGKRCSGAASSPAPPLAPSEGNAAGEIREILDRYHRVRGGGRPPEPTRQVDGRSQATGRASLPPVSPLLAVPANWRCAALAPMKGGLSLEAIGVRAGSARWGGRDAAPLGTGHAHARTRLPCPRGGRGPLSPRVGSGRLPQATASKCQS
jgi:hypothetical protein